MTFVFATAEDAEEAFYEAIGRSDLDTLMSVWADDEEIVCIHPTGQRLSGATAIRESWQNIFATNPSFNVRVTHQVRWESVLIAVHSIVETLCLGDDPSQHGPMLSTNVFIRGANGWRLLSRHTSAAADALGDDTAAFEPHSSSRHTLH
ncbi:YybH family protein [Propionivibrio limicola]|uniref:YybH family protein n=1 Tax=Propionivibrio limicola TaxID=167645 RepID=UPI001292A479|nr:nuclear transport factor 2 family protein [Propionivibrio limicola]